MFYVIIRNKLPQGTGNIIHSFMMGTVLDLGPAENVELIQVFLLPLLMSP